MKYSKTTPILAALMLAATVVPAYALDVNVMGNLDTKPQDGRMYKGSDATDQNDDDKNDDRKPMPMTTGAGMGMNNRGPRMEDRGMMERDNALSNRVKAWAMSAGTIGKVPLLQQGLSLSKQQQMKLLLLPRLMLLFVTEKTKQQLLPS
jgi:hypothetical protein